MKLSVVILTKNEERNIERCLNSVKHADEIIVVDDNSTDKTVEIAQKHNAKIFKRNLENDFSAQRNFGMEKVQGSWVLFVDADEELTPQLVTEINSVINNDERRDRSRPALTYSIKRRDFFLGKEIKHGDVKTARNKGIIRLMKKDSGKWIGKIHETYQPDVGNSRDCSLLKSYINHYPHPTVKDFLNDVNYYSTVRAKELYSTGRNINVIEIMFVPFAKFIWNYFFRLGFLDGPEGFIYAFFMSFHSFLVRSKLYQYKNFPENKLQ